MTRDELKAQITAREGELKQLKADLRASGPDGGIPLQQLSNLSRRQGELQVEIVALRAMLEEL